jgi:hypothetical protein
MSSSSKIDPGATSTAALHTVTIRLADWEMRYAEMKDAAIKKPPNIILALIRNRASLKDFCARTGFFFLSFISLWLMGDEYPYT